MNINNNNFRIIENFSDGLTPPPHTQYSEDIIDTTPMYSPMSDNMVTYGVSLGYYSGAALKNDGTVVSWGDIISYPVESQLRNVKALSVGDARAALKYDGTVVTWGYGPFGGEPFVWDDDEHNGVEVDLTNIILIPIF